MSPRKKDKKQINKIQKQTFSKRWMSIILTCSVCWITMSYILAFFDKADIAQELSKQIVIVVISSLLAYFAKSFFETKEEEKNKILRDQMMMSEYENSDDEMM